MELPLCELPLCEPDMPLEEPPVWLLPVAPAPLLLLLVSC